MRKYSEVTGLPMVELDSGSIQTEHIFRWTHYKMPNNALQMSLENQSLVHDYEFTVTDQQFISVLGTTDAPNALLLLHNGMRSAEDVTEFMHGHGLEPLLREHGQFANAAIESGLKPLDLLDFMNATDARDRNMGHAADAVRTFALEKKVKDIQFRSSLGNFVLKGDARYEDIRDIGAALVHRHFDLEELSTRLYMLATSSDVPYTAAHLRSAIERRMQNGMDKDYGDCLLEMIGRYGGTIGLSIQNPVALRHTMYVRDSIQDEITLLPYADAVYSRILNLDNKMPDIAKLFDHGISIEDAGRGLAEGRSAQQIIAMKDGVEEALTDGWL